MGKFDNAYFNFSIEPEDSEFLKSWSELRKDDGFQRKLSELKNHLEYNKTLLTTTIDINKNSKINTFEPYCENDWLKTVHEIPSCSFTLNPINKTPVREYTKIRESKKPKFQSTVQNIGSVFNSLYEGGIPTNNNDSSILVA